MIAAAGYDKESKTLQVLFHTGDLYEYYEVEPETFQELLDAPSKGRYMLSHIIDFYAYTKVRKKR
jgi:hypothetical protein